MSLRPQEFLPPSAKTPGAGCLGQLHRKKRQTEAETLKSANFGGHVQGGEVHGRLFDFTGDVGEPQTSL